MVSYMKIAAIVRPRNRLWRLRKMNTALWHLRKAFLLTVILFFGSRGTGWSVTRDTFSPIQSGIASPQNGSRVRTGTVVVFSAKSTLDEDRRTDGSNLTYPDDSCTFSWNHIADPDPGAWLTSRDGVT